MKDQVIGKLKDLLRNKNQTYAREVMVSLALKVKPEMSKKVRILDVGCGFGTDLVAVSKIFEHTELYGIDLYEPRLERCQERNIKIQRVDLETETFPYENGYFDIVICNQVLEHIKNIYNVLAEIARLVRSGGYVFIGIPNLASWHNRLALSLIHI